MKRRKKVSRIVMNTGENDTESFQEAIVEEGKEQLRGVPIEKYPIREAERDGAEEWQEECGDNYGHPSPPNAESQGKYESQKPR